MEITSQGTSGGPPDAPKLATSGVVVADTTNAAHRMKLSRERCQAFETRPEIVREVDRSALPDVRSDGRPLSRQSTLDSITCRGRAVSQSGIHTKRVATPADRVGLCRPHRVPVDGSLPVW